MHDAMLTTIFKAVHDDSVPESYLGIYFTGTKNKMGCEIPSRTEETEISPATKNRPKM